MGDGFNLVFRAYMTPWTQECMYFILLGLSNTGISVEPDPFLRGLGLEEQWSAPWSNVISLEPTREPEPVVRIEFSTANGQTTIRDLRVPTVSAPPFDGYSGAQVIQCVWLAYQEEHRLPSAEQVFRILLRLHPRRVAQDITQV